MAEIEMGSEARDGITPLLGPDGYGSLESGGGGNGGGGSSESWNQIRRRIPKTNRPPGGRSSGASARKVLQQQHPAGFHHRHQKPKGKASGKAVLTSLWAFDSIHKRVAAGGREEEHVHHHPRRHSWLYTLLNHRSRQPSARIFKHFISAVIVIDLAFYIASTEPQYLIDGKKHNLFYWAEGVTSTIFLIEYVARLITCTESHLLRKYGPCEGRLRYMITLPALIDAFATLPFFIELLSGVPLPTLTFLRVFRLLRILKTESFSKALGAVNRVMFYNREILWVAFILCIFLVLVTAFLMYYLRPRNDPVDAADFSSIGATMYLSTLMLTGQGGPEGDLPWYTKSVVLLTGVFSIGMFAIPASMLTWGFEAEAERLAARAIQKARKKRRGGDASSHSSTSSSSSSSSDGDGNDDSSSSSLDTSDEEYMNVIAGDEDGDDKNEEDRELMGMFRSADADGSGTLTKSEFMRIMHATMSDHRERMESTVKEHVGTGSAAAGGGATMSGAEASALVERVKKLERKVDRTNEKLDRLLDMMQNGGSTK